MLLYAMQHNHAVLFVPILLKSILTVLLAEKVLKTLLPVL